MKRLVPAMVLSLGLAGAALAQSPGDASRNAANIGQGITQPRTGGDSGVVASQIRDPRSTTSGANLPDFMTREAPARDYVPGDTRVEGTPPAHWRGDTLSWEKHRTACAAQYATYDPITDDYMVRPGARERCTL